jgi:hypothetical protein
LIEQKNEEFKKINKELKDLQFDIEQINIKNNEYEQEIDEMK